MSNLRGYDAKRAERARIMELTDKGLTARQIAERIGRPLAGVRRVRAEEHAIQRKLSRPAQQAERSHEHSAT